MFDDEKKSLKLKVIGILFLLFVFVAMYVCEVTKNLSLEYARERILNEYKENSRIMATVWKYRAGESFYEKDGVYYCANGETVEEATQSWFDTWYGYVTVKDSQMSIYVNDGGKYKLVQSTVLDGKGNSRVGTYLENEEVLEKISNKKDEVDYSGFIEIDGKTYVASYSFMYRDDKGDIPYICATGAEIETVEVTMEQLFNNYLVLIIGVLAVVFIVVGALIFLL